MDKLTLQDDIETEYSSQEDYREKVQIYQVKGVQMTEPQPENVSTPTPSTTQTSTMIRSYTCCNETEAKY